MIAKVWVNLLSTTGIYIYVGVLIGTTAIYIHVGALSGMGAIPAIFKHTDNKGFSLEWTRSTAIWTV